MIQNTQYEIIIIIIFIHHSLISKDIFPRMYCKFERNKTGLKTSNSVVNGYFMSQFRNKTFKITIKLATFLKLSLLDQFVRLL